MRKILLPFLIMVFLLDLSGQVPKDMALSVPAWMEIDTFHHAILNWSADENATNYQLSSLVFDPYVTTIQIKSVAGDQNAYEIGILSPGIEYTYHIKKTNANSTNNGIGIIMSGVEIDPVHQRGRCLIAVDDSLMKSTELVSQLNILKEDMKMDGWDVQIVEISQTLGVKDVKNSFLSWYEKDFSLSQAIVLLGHIPVPYSGNTAYDGHTNHQGAWPADAYYGDMDGNWTDTSVSNTTPSREQNKNVPGDGKFDQSVIPGEIELEIGRVDFYDLPAFDEDMTSLTIQYLEKNHAFRTGQMDYPQRAIVENNFAGYDEGFGQTGWRNFLPMFGPEQVAIGSYEDMVDTSKYLWSYGCGAGSYTSAGGMGTTLDLWVDKEIKTVFTATFGSYFGDWDNTDNFLRSALGSGDILANAWAGRPVWLYYPMAMGKHLGFCTKYTQNANSYLFGLGYGAHSAHIALMGDPTLRMHPMKPAENLIVEFDDGNIELTWDVSQDAEMGYFVYRKSDSLENWNLMTEFVDSNGFTDYCIEPGQYSYMVKAARLEKTASGSYFNTSLGITNSIAVSENPYLTLYYFDMDMDGYGNPENYTWSCNLPPSCVENDLDCDDSDPMINPDAIEIADNGIDENCDGEDLITSVAGQVESSKIMIFPIPAHDVLWIGHTDSGILSYSIYFSDGRLLIDGTAASRIDISHINPGIYWINLTDFAGNLVAREKLIVLD